MKNLAVMLALAFLSSTVSAESFYNVKIIFRQGSVLEGFAQLPGNPGPSAIKFKETEKGKSHWIRPDSIKTVIYEVYGKTVEYDKLDVYTTPSHKLIREYYLEVKQRGYVTLYTYVDMDVTDFVGGTRTDFNGCWACLKKGESIATTVSGTEHKNKRAAFNAAANDYFKDDPALLAKINSEEYKWNDMEKIVEEYNRDKQ